MSVKKIVILLTVIALAAFVFWKIKGCQTPEPVIVYAKDQSFEKAKDSLMRQAEQLKKDNEWLVYKLNNSTATVRTKKNEVQIYDTIRSTVRIIDTIRKEAIVYIPQPAAGSSQQSVVSSQKAEMNPQALLKLPYAFNAKDSAIAFAGLIDTTGVTIHKVTLTNITTMKDEVKKTFWNETHAISFKQSNPYISTTIPAYIYRRPTRRGQFVEKVIAGALGFGLGYGASEFKIFKK